MTITPKQKQDVGNKTARKSRLIVFNDDINTFEWVIKSLVDVCDHTPLQAEQLTVIIHYKGKGIVKTGIQARIDQMCVGLTERGIKAKVES